MLHFKLYLSPVLLLLLLFTCQTWKVSESLPVMSKEPTSDSCVSRALTLLRNITEALAQNNLFSGFDCSEINTELNTGSRTPAACAPKESTCPEISKSTFNQESCLREIGKDLSYYYKFLTAQYDPEGILDVTVLSSLTGYMKNCWSLPMEPAVKEPAADYDKRLNLCKVLKGFQLRAVTINRAVGFINSGEHDK